MKFISQLPRRLWLLLGIPVGLALYLLALFVPGFAEWYARYPYHWLSLAVNRVTGLLPFSLAEILLVLLIAVVLFWLIFGIVRFIRKRENRRKRLVRFFADAIVCPFCGLVPVCGYLWHQLFPLYLLTGQRASHTGLLGGRAV